MPPPVPHFPEAPGQKGTPDERQPGSTVRPATRPPVPRMGGTCSTGSYLHARWPSRWPLLIRVLGRLAVTPEQCPPGTLVRWQPPYIPTEGLPAPDPMHGEVLPTPDTWPYLQTTQQAFVMPSGTYGVAIAVDYERLEPDA